MKKVFFIFLSLFLTFNIFSQEVEEIFEVDFNKLSQKCLEQANNAYDEKDYESAYKKINMALEFAEKPEDSPSLMIIARTIYKKILEINLEKEDSLRIIEIDNNIQKYPSLANNDILLLVDQTQRKIELKTEKINIELVTQNNKSVKNLISIVIIAITVMLCIVIAIILIVQIALRKNRLQQEKYIKAIQNLAENQDRANQLLLGGITDLYGGKTFLGITDNLVWKPALALPEVDFSEEDLIQLKELALKCEELGEKIDNYTQRKNNSKNVSELVYKLSIALGISQGMAMLNFCAAMVYDAGFLGLDTDLINSESLTEEQKSAMENHVLLAEKYIDFVPIKYWSIFEDAVMKHHENIDGSGYPNQLKGEEIPHIARLIRVAESYVSLSSHRNYRETLDKETAIEILKNKPQFYDKDVVLALDKIV